VKPVLEQEISAVLQAQEFPEAMEVWFAFPASHGADDTAKGTSSFGFMGYEFPGFAKCCC
jgi:hypothetical protein